MTVPRPYFRMVLALKQDKLDIHYTIYTLWILERQISPTHTLIYTPTCRTRVHCLALIRLSFRITVMTAYLFNFTRYYSKTTWQHSKGELINQLDVCMTGALKQFKEMNGRFPERIIIFRFYHKFAWLLSSECSSSLPCIYFCSRVHKRLVIVLLLDDKSLTWLFTISQHLFLEKYVDKYRIISRILPASELDYFYFIHELLSRWSL